MNMQQKCVYGSFLISFVPKTCYYCAKRTVFGGYTIKPVLLLPSSSLLPPKCNRFLRVAYDLYTHSFPPRCFDRCDFQFLKKNPPLFGLGVLTGIVLDHLLDLFLSNFFVFCEKSGFTGSSPTLADL